MIIVREICWENGFSNIAAAIEMTMHIHKFGGASVKDADAVRNVAKIVRAHSELPLVIVVSAMHKTTNALERVYDLMIANDPLWKQQLDEVMTFHFDIVNRLFPGGNSALTARLGKFASVLDPFLALPPEEDPDALYDRVVSIGELCSTAIISQYLQQEGIINQWLDARQLIITDSRHREGRVLWDKTCHKINKDIDKRAAVYVTQGFIAADESGRTVTLGREGSDYSAAILAYCLGAGGVTIWKDVPGVLNADPKIFPEAVKRDEVSFREAIELAYYGASVIHPRTIQPLMQKGIDLFVRSFVNPGESGTMVGKDAVDDRTIPSYITQKGQWLITIATRDLSFIVEEHLTAIFAAFARNKVKIDIMQNSAVNFSVSAHDKSERMQKLIDDLKNDFEVRYNDDLELLTIRHYNREIIEKLTAGRNILMEQRTRETYRVLMA